MPRAYELVGTLGAESLDAKVLRARRLLEDGVRPESRVHLRLSIHPRHMDAVCAVPACPREAVAANGLCNGHELRRRRIGERDVHAFAASTDPILRGSYVLNACEVPGCRVRDTTNRLCYPHRLQWLAAGRPERAAWSLAAAPLVDLRGTCVLPHCELGAGAGALYCFSHQRRWAKAGRPGPEEFEAIILNYGDPMNDFRRLPGQLQLEIQYGLQRSRDAGFAASSHSYSWTVRMLVRVGASTLLERNLAEWLRLYDRSLKTPRSTANSRAFLVYAVDQLAELVEGSGWAAEYPRPIWQLHRLGYTSAARRLNFAELRQPWLVDPAKRWIHWRLTVEERSIATATADLQALRRLSEYLHWTGQAAHSIRQLTRPVLEGHLSWLRQQNHLGSATVRDSVSALAVFLRALRDHEDWAPELPRTAVIYSSDYPRMDPLRARGLSSHVMTQVRAALPSWPHPDSRFLTELMLASGLRIGDATALAYDPVVTDADGNPYIRYWNQKMRREAYVPIGTATVAGLRAQQSRVAVTYPSQTAAYLGEPAPRRLPFDGLRLFPAQSANPDGTRPFSQGTYGGQLRRWLRYSGIRDEAGRPVAISAHQWRHTFATTLVNAGVRLEVVKQLLDHSSLEMASHYARLLDTTMRAEWDAAQGRDEDLDHLLPPDVAWANRSRTALPNGHCGLPRQQACDHSNKCLSCPVFITTAADLPAHEDQRRRTLTLIARLDNTGQTRLADQNRLVLDQLDARIAQIRRSLSGEDRNAG